MLPCTELLRPGASHRAQRALALPHTCAQLLSTGPGLRTSAELLRPRHSRTSMPAGAMLQRTCCTRSAGRTRSAGSSCRACNSSRTYRA